MNQNCSVTGLAGTVTRAARLLAHLSPTQYRVVLALIGTAGMLTVYQGSAGWLVCRILTATGSSAEIADREAERRALTGTLIALEADVARHRSVDSQAEGHAQEVVANSPEQLVNLIDRAARQSSLTLGEIQSKGVAPGAGTVGAPRRYQLYVAGSYRGIAAFVAVVSGEQNLLRVVEVEVKGDGWAYPSRPLEARVVLQAEG